MLTLAERLQLEAAVVRLDELYRIVPDTFRSDVAYIAARLDKVLTGHASHR